MNILDIMMQLGQRPQLSPQDQEKRRQMFPGVEEYHQVMEEQRRRKAMERQMEITRANDGIESGVNDFQQKLQQFLGRFQRPQTAQTMPPPSFPNINSKPIQQGPGQLRQPTPWSTLGHRG